MTTETGLNFRRSRLLAAIRSEGGRWTTRRTMTFFKAEALGTYRSTARDDLKHLAGQGYLDIRDVENDRYFILADTRVGA
ncbi:hypothetical protein QMK19_03200 [Streptomyces sp. H10-C2]|uniref:hypothetical protein n=1 Tax=unclassified Streptomyces TaxID=2593676 RepID=UPI0024B9CE0A|nr:MULTISPECIES: hypothetical protein [unclassified Streptomyces]MDJ0342192.1 hypothetical protein [Streptomyces sp. PH10-H1]MDJ0368706.1 hypothetical protein [Streptomyces sp. H10-C2]